MTEYIWGSETKFFFDLTPDTVLDSIEKLGLRTTGRCLQLSSMENRVYEVEIEVPHSQVKNESDKYIVVKFYRPGRWSFDQIKDEHNFLFDLLENELPVIAPLKLEGESIFKLENMNIYYTLFPKKGGRAPDEFSQDDFSLLGRTIARIHNIGELHMAKNRITIDATSFGLRNLDFLKQSNIIPNNFKERYYHVVEQICQEITPLFQNVKNIRIHGDCHRGNIIKRDESFYFIDFDDMLNGPAIQDLWLIIPGRDEESNRDFDRFIDSYETMRSFNYQEKNLVEPLRTLRYIHFSAWMAKRWDDPIFKINFPYFNSDQYWAEQISDLYDQLEIINIQKQNSGGNFGNNSGYYHDDY